MVIFAKTFENLNYGIGIGGERHSNEAYADDVAILAQTTTKMN